MSLDGQLESQPVASVVDLDEGDRALNLALNKVQDDWGHEKLAMFLAELDDYGFDLLITGFGELEIEELLAPTNTADAVKDDGFDPEAEVQECAAGGRLVHPPVPGVGQGRDGDGEAGLPLAARADLYGWTSGAAHWWYGETVPRLWQPSEWDR